MNPLDELTLSQLHQMIARIGYPVFGDCNTIRPFDGKTQLRFPEPGCAWRQITKFAHGHEYLSYPMNTDEAMFRLYEHLCQVEGLA